MKKNTSFLLIISFICSVLIVTGSNALAGENKFEIVKCVGSRLMQKPDGSGSESVYFFAIAKNDAYETLNVGVPRRSLDLLYAFFEVVSPQALQGKTFITEDDDAQRAVEYLLKWERENYDRSREKNRETYRGDSGGSVQREHRNPPRREEDRRPSEVYTDPGPDSPLSYRTPPRTIPNDHVRYVDSYVDEYGRVHRSSRDGRYEDRRSEAVGSDGRYRDPAYVHEDGRYDRFYEYLDKGYNENQWDTSGRSDYGYRESYGGSGYGYRDTYRDHRHYNGCGHPGWERRSDAGFRIVIPLPPPPHVILGTLFGGRDRGHCDRRDDRQRSHTRVLHCHKRHRHSNSCYR